MKKINFVFAIALVGISARTASAGVYIEISGGSSLYATTNISDSIVVPKYQQQYKPTKRDPANGYYNQSTAFRFRYHPDVDNPGDTAPYSDATQVNSFSNGYLTATHSISTCRSQVFAHLLPCPTVFEADSNDPNKQQVQLPTRVGYVTGLRGSIQDEIFTDAQHPGGVYAPVYTIVANVDVYGQVSLGGYGGGTGGSAEAHATNAGIRTDLVFIP